jgi:hypothetical protein
MARKPVKAAATSRNPEAVCADVASIIKANKAEVSAAETALASAKGKKLPAIVAALKGVEPITQDAWNASWKDTLAKALAANGMADMSVKSEVSMLKVVFIGATNGYTPAPDHGSPRAFADFIREELGNKALITPGGNSGKRAPHAKGGKATAPTTKPGTPASPATSLNDAQIARALFAKIGQNPTQDQLDLLVRMIRQNPAKFWTKITALAQGN